MGAQFSRHLPIRGTFNVRDLGGYPIPAGETRWRRVLRADSLHKLDDEGMQVLIDEGVGTIIDLRHPDELVTQPNPFHGHMTVCYHNVSLFDELAPKPRPGHDVLLELYKRALDTKQAALVEIMTLIAEGPDGGVLFHCAAGKDRTGIVAALLLAIAGVDTTLIIEDYALTARMIAPMVDGFIADAVARGADLEAFVPLLAAEPATMAATFAHIETNYGSAAAYLEHIGLTSAAIARVRSRLTGDA